MSNDSQQDRIDNYLLGLGTPEERKEFSEEISRNPEISAQVAETELAMAAIEIHEDSAMKARLQQLEASLKASDTTPATNIASKQEAKVVEMKPVKRSGRSWLAIAASVLLLLAVGWYVLQMNAGGSPAQIAMANFEPYDNIAQPFERGSTEESLQADAYRAYEAGDYATAERGFAALPDDGKRPFYLGQSLLAQEKFAEAEAVFLRLVTSDSPFRQESEYYLALAQLAQGDTAAAKAKLTNIVSDEQHLSYTEARKLLDAL